MKKKILSEVFQFEHTDRRSADEVHWLILVEHREYMKMSRTSLRCFGE